MRDYIATITHAPIIESPSAAAPRGPRSHEVTHRPDANRRLDDVDSLRRNNEWYGKSHNEGRPWNLDRVNGKLDGNDDLCIQRRRARGVPQYGLDAR